MPNCAQIANIYSILSKTERYFARFGDISTFKRYFHCTLHVECYARRFWCRKKQACAKNAIIYSILKKPEPYFAIVGDIATFIRYFHIILHTKCYARRFERRNTPICVLNATIYTILKKTVRYIRPVGDISKFERYFHRILHVECYAPCF